MLKCLLFRRAPVASEAVAAMARMRHELTEQRVSGLKPGEIVWDRKVSGFGARHQGRRTKFFLQYRLRGRLRWYTIGKHGDPYTVETARKEAKDLKHGIEKGVDPHAVRAAHKMAGDTFDTIAADYIEREAKKRNRSWRETERIFDKYVSPRWGSRAPAEIRRGDVTALLDHVQDNHGDVMADRVLAAVRRLFNWYAARRDDFVSPVVKGMARTKPADRARDRILTDEELRALWKASEAADPPAFGSMVRMMLLTAQRRGEVQLMRWSEIDGDVWTIPAARYKTKIANAVPLCASAQSVLGEVKRIESSDYVFTLGRRTSRRDGRDAEEIRPFGNLGDAKADFDEKMLAELRKAAEERGADAAKAKLPRWTMHDLRRTAKTLMTRAGIAPHVSERVLGHVIKGVEGVYDRHDYGDEKRHALDALAAEIGRVQKGQSAKLLRLKRGAA